MASKVTTLIDVNDNTLQLYPRTKASAVSDNDGNTLGNIAVYNAQTIASGVDTVKIENILIGADISNVLGSDSSSGWTRASYTATEDCFAVGYGHYSGNNGGTHMTILLDGQTVFDTAKADSGDQYGWIFMKKGQTLEVSGEYNYYKIFGLKH